MPVAQYLMPDGRVAQFQVPDGTTPEQAHALISTTDFSKLQPGQQIDQKTTQFNMLQSGIIGAGQGASAGFGDEIMAGLESPVMYAGGKIANALGADTHGLSDKSLGDIYNLQRQKLATGNQQAASDNPYSYDAGYLTGAVGTGVAGGATKAGAAVTGSIGRGLLPQAAGTVGKAANFATKALQAGVVGGASSALSAAGGAEPGQRIESAEQAAIPGALVGAAIPGAGAVASSLIGGTKNAIKGVAARSPIALEDATEAMKSSAGALYNQMRDAGAVLSPSTSNGLLATIDAAINKNKFIPALNPKTTGIIDHLAESIQNNGGQIGLDDLDQYRRLLGRIGPTEDGVSAGAARGAIDDIVNGLTNQSLVNGDAKAAALLNQGRAQYAQASKFDDIADVLTKADGDPNRIKAGLTRFLNNDKNTRGWSDDEIAALRDAASRSSGEAIMRGLGTFGFDFGKVKNVALPGLTTGASYLNPVTIPVVAAGTAARHTGKYIARGKAENLLQVLEGATPQGSAQPPISPVLAAPVGAASNLPPQAQQNALLQQAMRLPPAQARALLQRRP